MKFADFDLSAVGHEVQLVGGIYAGNGHAYLCYFPDYGQEYEPVALEMTPDDWKALLRQSDLVETEVLAKAQDGTSVKAVIRKCERNIEQGVSWSVYRRAHFQCEYCGKDDVPLTVDHLVLYEEGGPSNDLDNLACVCRRCNKTRGRMHYDEWLMSPYYLRVSRGLTEEQRKENSRGATMLGSV
jgi:hypothetical protein